MPTVFTNDVLFLHVPKAGGTSITHYLLNTLPGPIHYIHTLVPSSSPGTRIVHIPGFPHQTIESAAKIMRVLGIDVEQIPLILAVLRNPYDLAVSLYGWFRRPDNVALDGNALRTVALTSSFREFVIAAAKQRGDHLGQARGFFHLRGTIPPNLRVVRFDYLEVDVHSALAEFGIRNAVEMPHYNRSTRGTYPTYYDALTEEIVFAKNRWVFERGFFDRLQCNEFHKRQ